MKDRVAEIYSRTAVLLDDLSNALCNEALEYPEYLRFVEQVEEIQGLLDEAQEALKE